jgi:2'-5' RNA ligase
MPVMERYYVGLRVPSPLNEQIAALQQELFEPDTTVPPLDPHLTLMPPPRLARLPVARILSHVSSATSGFWPMEAELTGIEIFREQIFTLQVGGQRLHELHERLEAAVPADAADPGWRPHPFVPHITVSETKGGTPFSAARKAAYERAVTPLLGQRFILDQLTLYHWVGPRQYEAQDL